MDIQEIVRRARLPSRLVRYTIDQRLLPGLRGRLQKHLAGQPRSFTPMEAYFIACAALLLEGGAKRQTVTKVLARLAAMPWPAALETGSPTSRQRAVARPTTAVEAIYSWACEPTATLCIGDGANLRIKLGRLDTGWIEPRAFAPLREDYQPRVLIELDLATLWAEFRPGDAE